MENDKEESEQKNNKIVDETKGDFTGTVCKVTYRYDAEAHVVQSTIEGKTIKEAHSLVVNKNGVLTMTDGDKSLPGYTIDGKGKNADGEKFELFTDWWTRLLKDEKGNDRGKPEKFTEESTLEEPHINVYPRLCINDSEKNYNTENHYGLKENEWEPIIGPYCPTRTILYKTILRDSSVPVRRGKTMDRADFTAVQIAAIFHANRKRNKVKQKPMFEALLYKSKITQNTISGKTGYEVVPLSDIIANIKKGIGSRDNIKGHTKVHYKIEGKVVKLYDSGVQTKIDELENEPKGKTNIKVYKSDYGMITNFYGKYFENLIKGKTNAENDSKTYYRYKEENMLLVTGVRPSKSNGIVPANEAQIDHIHPTVSKVGVCGSNSYCNAAIVSRLLNNKKSNDTDYCENSKES